MATTQWYISRHGKLQGPYTWAQLQQMAEAAQLQPADVLCPEGGAPTRAQGVPGLFPAPAAVAAAPVPLPVAARSGQRGIAAIVLIGVVCAVFLLTLVCGGAVVIWTTVNRNTPAGLTDGKAIARTPPATEGNSDAVPPVAPPPRGKDPFPLAKVNAPKRTDKEPLPTAAPPIAPKLEPTSAGEVLSPAAQAAVNRGAAYLKGRLMPRRDVQRPNPDGYPQNQLNIGAHALAGLALLQANAPAEDPAVQSALEAVRADGAGLRLVYALGTVLFFLNRLDEMNALKDSDRALRRTLILRLISGQHADGRWTYFHPPLTQTDEDRLVGELQSKTYKPWARSTGDQPSNSMTQFALLALWGSRKHGIPTRPVFMLAAKRFHQSQHEDGSWDYDRGNGRFFHDSNTCAGLLALAMEKTLREDKNFREDAAQDPPANPRADEQCVRGFAHLAKVIGRTRDDPLGPNTRASDVGTMFRADAWGDYYFLWCLERVSVIYDRKKIGGKDWYAWGAPNILKSQRDNGSWLDRHGEVPDTCFAILFLTRANLAPDLTESIRNRQGAAQP